MMRKGLLSAVSHFRIIAKNISLCVPCVVNLRVYPVQVIFSLQCLVRVPIRTFSFDNFNLGKGVAIMSLDREQSFTDPFFVSLCIVCIVRGNETNSSGL